MKVLVKNPCLLPRLFDDWAGPNWLTQCFLQNKSTYRNCTWKQQMERCIQYLAPVMSHDLDEIVTEASITMRRQMRTSHWRMKINYLVYLVSSFSKTFGTAKTQRPRLGSICRTDPITYYHFVLPIVIFAIKYMDNGREQDECYDVG